MQSPPLPLPLRLPIVPQLRARLALNRFPEPRVHVRRRTTAQCVRGRRLRALFAVRPQHVRVVGLAGDLGRRVGREGSVRWRAAGWERLGVDDKDWAGRERVDGRGRVERMGRA